MLSDICTPLMIHVLLGFSTDTFKNANPMVHLSNMEGWTYGDTL